jgi:Uma2 family endonuclease
MASPSASRRIEGNAIAAHFRWRSILAQAIRADSKAERARATFSAVLGKRWNLDPDDPRAPTLEQWASLDPEERARICDALPSELPRQTLPEGDRHRVPKERALDALGEYFRRIRRRVYLSSELPVYYPGERLVAPDVIAVLDVEPHPRDRWVVAQEEKGIDLALEITLGGDRRKDLDENVSRYARLGIPEYFVLDARSARLHGYRLDAGGGRYRPIAPQYGRWASQVLGLDLALESGRVRFYHGSAPLLEAAELVGRLEAMMDEVTAHKEAAEREKEAAERSKEGAERSKEAAERSKEEAERGKEEAERSKEEAERRAERLAERLRALGVDPDEV